MEKRTEEQKKEFAKDQVEFLKQNGIKDKKRISRIFRSAGPGQIREAWAFATSEEWNTPIGRVRLNLFDCIVSYGGPQEFDVKQIAELLQYCGFYVPKVFSENAFFKVLDGALEILIPGSYEFDEEGSEADIPEDAEIKQMAAPASLET